MFETKEELKEAIRLYSLDKKKSIELYGETNEWNVSKITDMSNMFKFSNFNDEISKWDVSSVTDMSYMFNNSKFKGNISKWDISNLIEGKEEIIKLGGKEKEEKKIIEKIKEGYEECPVTREIIKDEYIKCKTCNNCFSIEVKEWIIKNKKCPYCRSKWSKIIMYSQK